MKRVVWFLVAWLLVAGVACGAGDPGEGGGVGTSEATSEPVGAAQPTVEKVVVVAPTAVRTVRPSVAMPTVELATVSESVLATVVAEGNAQTIWVQTPEVEEGAGERAEATVALLPTRVRSADPTAGYEEEIDAWAALLNYAEGCGELQAELDVVYSEGDAEVLWDLVSRMDQLVVPAVVEDFHRGWRGKYERQFDVLAFEGEYWGLARGRSGPSRSSWRPSGNCRSMWLRSLYGRVVFRWSA